MAKSETLEWETIFTDIIGQCSTTVTYLASKAVEFVKKRKIRAITPFKVIQGHRDRYQSKARMRLPISYRFGVIAIYRSNFGHLRF